MPATISTGDTDVQDKTSSKQQLLFNMANKFKKTVYVMKKERKKKGQNILKSIK